MLSSYKIRRSTINLYLVSANDNKDSNNMGHNYNMGNNNMDTGFAGVDIVVVEVVVGVLVTRRKWLGGELR